MAKTVKMHNKLVCVLPNITVLINNKKTLIDNENIFAKKVNK